MRKKITLYTVALLGIVILFTACKKEYETIQTTDEAKIEAYVKQSSLTFTKDPNGTGYRYSITNPGTGDFFKNTDSVLYSVTIKSLTGVQYIESPVNGNLGTYVGYSNTLLAKNIPAIRNTILNLKPGGTATIILPSYLAFGKNGYSTIPSNEVVLVNITTYVQKKQWELDESKILAFLASKGITGAIKHSSRVYYKVLTTGTGTDLIDNYSTLETKYTGRLLDGTVFDSSTSFTTTPTGVILGWGKVLPLFTAGTKVRLFIPSDLGYGAAGNGSIPANAVLDFDIEIVKVTN